MEFKGPKEDIISAPAKPVKLTENEAIHFTSLSFYVMFIYDYAIFYGCFLSVENGTKKQ